jgi:hypothetical protein
LCHLWATILIATIVLVQGTATRADERMEIWASPQQIVGDGYNGGLGNLSSGAGPVTINNFVPTGAIVDTIIPLFVTDLPNALEQSMAEQMLLFRNFGLGYDNNGASLVHLIPGT